MGLKSNYDIIKTVLQTEKSSRTEGMRQYQFLVANDANKIEIKKAIEDIYKVNVIAVRTMVMPGKAKRVRYQQGYTTEEKKAIVTLKEGQKISPDTA